MKLIWMAMLIWAAPVNCAGAADSHVALSGDRLYFKDSGAAEANPMPTGAVPASLAGRSLMRYRADLEAFRREFGGVREMPDVPFFQFGMGLRSKYLFKNGVLTRAPKGPEVRKWEMKESVILPSDYSVVITTTYEEIEVK